MIRIPALDGLRGLAILLVLLHHFTVLIPQTMVERWFVRLTTVESGIHGVDLFFVLSGFLITGILLDSKGKRGYYKNFYKRRVLRIFPLYYLVLFFSFCVLPMVMVFPVAK